MLVQVFRVHLANGKSTGSAGKQSYLGTVESQHCPVFLFINANSIIFSNQAQKE